MMGTEELKIQFAFVEEIFSRDGSKWPAFKSVAIRKALNACDVAVKKVYCANNHWTIPLSKEVSIS